MSKLHYLILCLIFVKNLVFAQGEPFLFVKTNEDIGERAITCIIDDSIS